MSFAPGISSSAAAFRSGADDPVRALARALAAAERGKEDRAILWRVESAAADAEAARRRLADGKPLSPLDGIPLVIKDCIDLAGLPTTNGTKVLLDRAAGDAPLVRRLREAGAVIFAKGNMHELGIQPTGVNPHWGTPRNPWAEGRIPGGSSSGPAVAVATGIGAGAIGTDAGGSIRVPAALNGLVGLKPTYGAIPDDGVAKLTRDLDHVGPIAWTVEDATLLFEVLAARPVDRAARADRALVLADFFVNADADLAAAVRDAIARVFPDAPAEPSPVARWAAACEFVVVGADAAELTRELQARHRSELGADTQVILNLGGGLPLEDRRRAAATRAAMRAELLALLERADVLLAPATGSFALPLHPVAARTGELDTRRIARLAAVTFPANLTGLPAVTVPCVAEGLPAGLQILGRPGDEARVLAAARRVEAAFGPRKPPRWHGD